MPLTGPLLNISPFLNFLQVYGFEDNWGRPAPPPCPPPPPLATSLNTWRNKEICYESNAKYVNAVAYILFTTLTIQQWTCFTRTAARCTSAFDRIKHDCECFE